MRPWLERLWYPEGDRGLTHALAAPALAVASMAYSAGAAVRARKPRARVEGVRVVSVGNLNAGGAGKTPAVIFLAQLAREHGKKVAVLSRGYGRVAAGDAAFDSAALPDASTVGDEPRLIAQRCPGVRVFVGSDRARLASKARDEGFELLLLDDGFQQRQLACDAEIVVVDDAVLFGSGHRLPWGPLREEPSAVGRATLVWRRLAEGAARAPLHSNEVHARHFVRPDPALVACQVIVLAGTARPSSVTASIERLGALVVGECYFPDHHRFSLAELQQVEALAKEVSATIVTTEKDAQRLPTEFPAVRAVLDVELIDGREKLLATLGV